MTNISIANRKAQRDYFFNERFECGIELIGAEVKSIRAGHVHFKDSFARVEKGQVRLYNLHIDPYTQASYQNLEPDRIRRLLLRKSEIKKIDTSVNVRGNLLIPTKLYINKRGFVKIELALAKGKKMYDKRETVKKRTIDRDIGRAMRQSRKRNK